MTNKAKKNHLLNPRSSHPMSLKPVLWKKE